MKLILALYLLFGIIHIFAPPIVEAWDKSCHYPIVKYIADNHFTLPVQTFPSLRIVPEPGGSADNYLNLRRVRITP